MRKPSRDYTVKLTAKALKNDGWKITCLLGLGNLLRGKLINFGEKRGYSPENYSMDTQHDVFEIVTPFKYGHVLVSMLNLSRVSIFFCQSDPSQILT